MRKLILSCEFQFSEEELKSSCYTTFLQLGFDPEDLINTGYLE